MVELLGLTLGIFLVSIAAGVAFIVPLVVLGYGVETTLVLVGATAFSQLAMFGLGYAYRRFRDVPIRISWPSLSNVGYVVGGVIVALGLAVGLSVLLAALGLLPGSVIGETATTNPTYLLGLAVLSVVVVAPVEEYVFRGVVQGRLRQRFGPVSAVGGASLLFGSLHLTNYTGNVAVVVAGALMIAVIGTVFGALYEHTGNLVVPALAHAIYNVFLLVVSHLALTAS